MIRELVGAELIRPEKHFRWRGGEITRMEGFTDAVFAFAVTLLVVSLEVPKTYSELIAAMKGFIAFAICFALLVQIWYQHYVYARRYGLQTRYAITLNFILLFVVLFYVYPLKFLFTLTVSGLSGGALAVDRHILEIQDTQVATLIVIYGAGFTAVFGVFALLHHYAYSKRRELNLDEYESIRTRSSFVENAADAVLGACVVLAAKLLPTWIGMYSSLLFVLLGLNHFIIGSIFGKRERLALEKMQAVSRAAATP
jgi:uncharacterized membrane protein